MVYNISMNNRQEKLLKNIIEIYIKTAKPVGSQVLSEDKSFSVSPATIRNDMLELESEDLIFQPHISAGRIPTMSGYRVYLDSLMEVRKLKSNEKKELENKHNEDIRELAKLLVEKTNLATIVSFSPSDFYFTGLFNLFSQPEFEDHKAMLSMTQVVDSLEKAIGSIYHDIDKPTVLLGEDNPFSDNCSVIATSLSNGKILTVLGPLRMDYSKILGLFEEIVKLK